MYVHTSGGNKRSKEMKAGLAAMRSQSATTMSALQADVDEKTHTISHDKNQALAQNQVRHSARRERARRETGLCAPRVASVVEREGRRERKG